MVQNGELTHLQKVWVLTECAKILAKTDQQKAFELVDAAANEARRIDVSDPGLPQGLIAVANALKVVDASRVWDATFDAVKAANSAEGFTGEDGSMILKFQSKGQSSVIPARWPSLIWTEYFGSWRIRTTIAQLSWREVSRRRDHAP